MNLDKMRIQALRVAKTGKDLALNFQNSPKALYNLVLESLLQASEVLVAAL